MLSVDRSALERCPDHATICRFRRLPVQRGPGSWGYGQVETETALKAMAQPLLKSASRIELAVA